ncbi:shikimate dehydrogenase [Heliophilum fasciatum]|uniref:Shikimate dehydrogenase (NADP(+)) n=1 Tax=Heliophilum fasciatum TaxID=35700 RepID=A0A4R2RSA7_9FIRM|nr:shikimate dehydrogenase [Heliophilum fasciatum]MCW2277305.1 shikimate dehydrogenase [Heliophilum fasciatum]TCP67142.1 shikimate dehydrogenase [Heliophilum fasciatum]
MIKSGSAIDGHTAWVALLGNPVGHSFSPAMHNAAFQAAGLNWAYGAYRVEADRLGEAVRGLAALGFRGANVTVPHKRAVLDVLDQIDERAARIGAVNTIVFDEAGRATGYNTDSDGFIRGLQADGIDVAGRSILLLGAGGGARAVAFALIDEGVRQLTIVNRSREAAEGLMAELQAACTDKLDMQVINWDPAALRAAAAEAAIVINATSLGMSTQGLQTPYPIDPALWLCPGLFVADLVYQPRETVLLAAGRAMGCRGQNGLAMLLYQGVAAWERWTGCPAPVDVMQRALPF